MKEFVLSMNKKAQNTLDFKVFRKLG